MLGLASPLPVAKALLVVFLVREELRAVQQTHLLFLLLPKRQGAALPGCLARGGSNGTVPDHPAGECYYFFQLTLSALITSFSL